jgi:hypothetical protein
LSADEEWSASGLAEGQAGSLVVVSVVVPVLFVAAAVRVAVAAVVPAVGVATLVAGVVVLAAGVAAAVVVVVVQKLVPDFGPWRRVAGVEVVEAEREWAGLGPPVVEVDLAWVAVAAAEIERAVDSDSDVAA